MNIYLMKATLVLVLLSVGAQLLLAQDDTLVWSIEMEDVVVTAQYAPTSTKEAVHQVEVIKAETWKTSGWNTLSDVLQQQLNLRVSPDPILGTALSMQGLDGQNIQLMIDGVPVVGRLGGNVDLSQLNLSQFERIEIVMGSMSAQFGSNASGGVINLISKQHQLNKWKVEAGGQVEDIGINNQYFRMGRKSGNWQLDGGIMRYQASLASIDSLRVRREKTTADGQTVYERAIPWNPKLQKGGDVNLTYRPNDSLRIRYGFRSFTEELAIYGEIRRPVFKPYAIDQYFTTTRQDHHLQIEHWLKPNLYGHTTIGWNVYDRLKDTQRLDIEPDTSSQEWNGQDTTRYTGLLARSSWSLLSEGNWSGQLGVEYLRETAAGQRIVDATTMEREPRMNNLAAWLNIRYRPAPEWTIEANTRLGYNDRYTHPLIPSVNVLWQANRSWQWRLSYARGFRAPSIQELFFNFIDVNHYIIGNASLAAEYAHNFRMYGQWENRNTNPIAQIKLSGALFYNHLSNRITLVEETVGRFTYDNLSIYKTHGINLKASWQPTPQLQLKISGAYTRLYNAFSEDFNATKRFIGLPEMSNQLVYALQKWKATASVSHRYIGQQDRYTINSAGALEQGFIEGYHLLDIAFQQRFWQNKLTIGVGVKNILDRQQVSLTGSNNGDSHSDSGNSSLVAFGRTYFVSVGLSL